MRLFSVIMLHCKVMYPKGGLICSEHINPRSSTERRSTASERECPTETVARFLLAEEQKAERDFLTKSEDHSNVVFLFMQNFLYSMKAIITLPEIVGG